MEGNITEDVCTRSFGWLQQQNNDARPWLWKFSNCFSATEQSFPPSAKAVGFWHTFAEWNANTPVTY